MKNRFWNCKNPNQGDHKKVLCVCSAGLIRSPTAAKVLADEPYNYNTRSCGVDVGHALIPLDEVLLEWADEVVCMEQNQLDSILKIIKPGKSVVCLDIEDYYSYGDPELKKMIAEKYKEATGKK